MAKKTLNQLRVEIDAVDKQIQSLIAKRAELVSVVAEVKNTQKADLTATAQSVFYRPEREAQVLRCIIERNNSLLKDQDMAHIFREIMSACLALEQPLNVAYLGPEGTYTQEAALKHFGHAVSTLDCGSIDDIFSAVDKGNAHYGMVPVENSSNGVVGGTIDMLYSTDLNICGEVEVSIRHQLMMLDAQAKIKTIYAHQQSFDQCRRYLENHYPKAALKAVSSNALAAKLCQDEPNAAAIASESALGIYNLQKVDGNIEDKAGNTTRFLVIGKDTILPSAKDKTSLLITVKHQSGSLFDLLEPFKRANINLLQLAKHPIPGVKWEYIFLIDIEGHQDDTLVKNAINTVKQKSLKLKILGSYPVAVL